MQVSIDSNYAALVIGVCVIVGFATSLDKRVNLMDAATPCFLVSCFYFVLLPMLLRWWLRLLLLLLWRLPLARMALPVCLPIGKPARQLQNCSLLLTWASYSRIRGSQSCLCSLPACSTMH